MECFQSVSLVVEESLSLFNVLFAPLSLILCLLNVYLDLLLLCIIIVGGGGM